MKRRNLRATTTPQQLHTINQIWLSTAFTRFYQATTNKFYSTLYTQIESLIKLSKRVQ